MKDEIKLPFGWGKILLTMALLVLLVVGMWLYHIQEEEMRQKVAADLGSIARLKADQINAWRKDQLDDASIIAQDPFIFQSVSRFIAHRSEGNARDLRGRFRSLARQHDYANLLLVDLKGKALLSLADQGHSHTGYLSALSDALQGGRPVCTDLHTGMEEQTPHISVVAPVVTVTGQIRKTIAALVFVSDVSSFLFPMVRFWPIPSKSAETLLVRRDGDRVLFLNDLRHRPDTALKLSFSVNRTQMPAVMAVLGEKGFVEGRDYRDVKVAAFLQPIPESTWFIVAKVDSREVFADWRFRSVLILGLLMGLMVVIVTVGFVLRQRERKVHYRSLYLSEAALRANAERHNITLKAIGDAVIATDIEGRVELVNPVAETLTGWTEAEARGRPLKEVFLIINEETRQKVEDPVARVLREGKVVGLANHAILTSRDGVERPIADSGAPIRDDKNKIAGVVLVFRDQSAERAAKETLRESEERFRMTFEQAAVGISHIALDGRWLRVNRKLCDILGYTREEMLEKTFQEVTFPDDLDVSLNYLQRLLSGAINSYSLEKRYARKDGSLLWINLTVTLSRKPSGEPDYTITIVDDITERKRVQERLQYEKARAQQYLDVADIMLLVLNVDQTVSLINPKGCSLLGYSAAEIIGKNWFDNFLMSDEKEKVKEVFNQMLKEETPPVHYYENSVRTKDGSARLVAWRNSYLRDLDGRIIGFLSSGEDITERKWAQEEQEKLRSQLMHAQKMESVGRLAGGVAHDYNNMLSVIIGNAELALAKTKPDDPFNANLKQILNAAKRSADITGKLLAFARKQTISPKVLDLNEAVEGMLKMLRQLMGEDIDFSWQPASVLWPVKVDPTQIDQVLANLCVNARDAIDGVGTVTIETEQRAFDEAYCADHPGSDPGEYVMLAVSDNGRGIDKETMAQIFDPFFTTKGAGEGTGLGLAMVYGIVKQNKGFINVYSEPGHGTTFKIYLPRHLGKEEEEIKPEIPAPIPSARGERVLLVEDEAAIMDMGRQMLEKIGYRVLAAGTPQEALRLAGENAGDIRLLITDVVMPDMNGRILADKVRAVCPQIKTLFMSGYTANVIAHRGELDEGVNFIQKPFSLKDLAAKVRAALDQE